MIRQFLSSEYCLKCQGCCRFREESSVWSPCLLDEEVIVLIDNPEIPAATMSLDRRLHPIPNPGGEGFICPFLSIKGNICRIYTQRPFECQLYPFLINLRQKKIILTVDLNCPYVKEKINTPEFKEYAEYLADFLNSPAQISLLKDNPQLLQAYEEVADVIELRLFDEPH